MASSLEQERDRVFMALTSADLALDLSELPDSAGIYSAWAVGSGTIASLRLEQIEGQESLTSRALYMGKAEDSLRKRVADTHFRTGKTGHSTLRRTLGALLGFESCPRPSKIREPNRKQLMHLTSNFSLVPADDERLTVWMLKALSVRVAISSWVPLEDLERALGPIVRPPLDQEPKPLWHPNPWRSQVNGARERLRLNARRVAGLVA